MAGIPSTVTSTVAVVTMAPWRAVTVTVPFGSVVSHVGTNATSWPQRSFPCERNATFAASAVPLQVDGLTTALDSAPTYSYVTHIETIRGVREVFVVVGDARTWMLAPE